MSDHLPFIHFGILERLHFSGQLIQTDPIGQERTIYFSQGQIIYATGGTHPVRRLHRQLTSHCPWIISHKERWAFYLDSVDLAAFPDTWEYALLNFWVSRQEITLEQAAKIIRSVVLEVLFEVAQTVAVNEQTKHDCWTMPELALIPVNTAVAEAQQYWQAWQNINLAQASPTHAPVVRQVEQIRQHSSAQVFHTLLCHLNGQHTLYNLAWQTQQNVVAIAKSLKPFIQWGWIELIQIPDLPPPYRNAARDHRTPPSNPQLRVPTKLVASPATRNALIACVDDSALVRLMLEKLLTTAGYRFVGIEDAQRAIGILLARKPDFIFLDLVMPNTNGYEVCEQLRQISLFQHTPIVILTGYDGFTSRMRSNFVGASDFLSKPLEAEAVLTMIYKYLEQQAPLSKPS